MGGCMNTKRYPKKNKCNACRNPMTWAAVRVQYGRLLRRGFTEEQVKAVLPRCQTCVTRWLKSQEVNA
jgi:hypothetical protein